MKTLFTILLGVILNITALAQEGPFKEYGEAHQSRKFCLYPSTLRMINISQNPHYNDMVNDIEKLLIYQLDSSAQASKSYLSMINEYRENGFEEYMTVYGGEQTLVLLGSDSREEMVGVFGSGKEGSLMFFLKGTIGFQKIPTLMNNFQANEMLDIFNIGNNRRNRRTPPHDDESDEERSDEGNEETVETESSE